MNMMATSERMPLQASSTDSLMPTISRMLPSRNTEYPSASRQISPKRLASNCSDKVRRSKTKVGGAIIRISVHSG